MSKASIHSLELGRPRSSAPMIDRYAVIPILACAYALIVYPLMLLTCDAFDRACLLETRPENKIFWPSVATLSIILALRNHARLWSLKWPPHLLCLLAYLSFAGVSVVWAFRPELSSIRFAQQVMVIASIVLPAMLATRKADLLRGLFLCFALASILNVFFVLGRPPIDYKYATWGYPGYFPGKNYLGECAAITLLLALHEMLNSGFRRAFSIVVAVIAILLLFLSNSKTSLGLALLVPCVAGVTLLASRLTRLSPAILLLCIPVCYAIVSGLTGFNMNRLSYALYGDLTFTGRTIIWEFADYEIGRRPLLGWGYQSFWLVGPDAPSVLDAPRWVKTMPNAHNGYKDTMLELGYVGLVFLLTFIVATLHVIGRMAAQSPARAGLVLSLALFVIITNGLESSWMRGFEFVWVVFVIIATEAGRYWQPVASTTPRCGSANPVGSGPRRRVLRSR